jgi:hydrogenase maturation protease
MADEGAGLYALDLLRKKFEEDKSKRCGHNRIDLVEAGTLGMSLLHQLEEREKIIFIDAGYCGSKPGEYLRFKLEEVISRKKSTRHSLHQFDLLQLLEYARQLDLLENKEIVIYCIQVAEIGMSEALTPGVAKNLPCLVRDIYHEIWPNNGKGI